MNFKPQTYKRTNVSWLLIPLTKGILLIDAQSNIVSCLKKMSNLLVKSLKFKLVPSFCLKDLLQIQHITLLLLYSVNFWKAKCLIVASLYFVSDCK